MLTKTRGHRLRVHVKSFGCKFRIEKKAGQQPALRVGIEFLEFTEDGYLRHPRLRRFAEELTNSRVVNQPPRRFISSN